MRRNLDLDHWPNKQQAVIAAYVEELEENDRKIAEGAWATSLDLSRMTFWYPLLMTYCTNHPLTQSLKREQENGTGTDNLWP
jgi:beta-xylosidase